MPIKEITLGKHITINKGNYESLRLECSVVVEVDDSDGIVSTAETFINNTLKAQAKAAGNPDLSRFGII